MNIEEVKAYFDSIAPNFEKWRNKNKHYYTAMKKFYSSIIPPAKDVLEIGWGTGELLDSVSPQKGVGLYFSEKMIEIIRKKYPNLSFIPFEPKHIHIEDKFDYIIMSDIIDYLPDVWDTFVELKKCFRDKGKIVISFINPFWQPFFILAGKLGLKIPEISRNFIPIPILCNFLALLDFEIEKKGFIPLFRNLGMIQYLVVGAKKKVEENKNLSCSVVIPCYNEMNNIERCIKVVPNMGKWTEIVVVDDGSTDNTAQIVREIMKEKENVKLVSYSPNQGKGYAVQRGFEASKGDVLMILDADMAVPPEELPHFFYIFERKIADFANGTRLVYSMEKGAMRHLNLLGNYMFSIIFTYLLGQRVTDTLCGTKALYKKDFLKMKMGKCPWGDFDLLFGAAKLGLKIVEIPVHYKRRIADESKMKAFKHGLQLLKICLYGFKELKLKR